jgi:hypothetical protein
VYPRKFPLSFAAHTVLFRSLVKSQRLSELDLHSVAPPRSIALYSPYEGFLMGSGGRRVGTGDTDRGGDEPYVAPPSSGIVAPSGISDFIHDGAP